MNEKFLQKSVVKWVKVVLLKSLQLIYFFTIIFFYTQVLMFKKFKFKGYFSQITPFLISLSPFVYFIATRLS